MIPGFNHNIKHNGTIYHIQTEDNGRDNPTIVSHLFLGGNILATRKNSYRDIVANENAEAIVREMMQEQHKTMIKDLIHGGFDDKIHATPIAKTKQETSKQDEKRLDEMVLDFLNKGKV